MKFITALVLSIGTLMPVSVSAMQADQAALFLVAMNMAIAPAPAHKAAQQVYEATEKKKNERVVIKQPKKQKIKILRYNSKSH